MKIPVWADLCVCPNISNQNILREHNILNEHIPILREHNILGEHAGSPLHAVVERFK